MNTVKKGNAFEDNVFRDISTELSNDRLHVNGKRSKIYQKKGYFSKDRQSEIVTDISIETFLPDAKEYSLLTIFECKDYNSTVPVNDIEEFHSKVQQIAGDNVKAIFVTTAALQKSAFNVAKSKNMGVIRYLPDNQVHIVLYCKIPTAIPERLNTSEFHSAFLNQGHISDGRYLYACDNRCLYSSLFSMLYKYLN
jgi:hypothetical protein